eukprot:3439131-Prymnesium_polylepis.1
MEAGELVPDDLIIGLVANELNKPECKARRRHPPHAAPTPPPRWHAICRRGCSRCRHHGEAASPLSDCHRACRSAVGFSTASRGPRRRPRRWRSSSWYVAHFALDWNDWQRGGERMPLFPSFCERAHARSSDVGACRVTQVPTKAILLEVPDDVLVERVTGRRLDPDTGKIYHMKFSPPEGDDAEEIKARLTQRADDTEEALRTRLKVRGGCPRVALAISTR